MVSLPTALEKETVLKQQYWQTNTFQEQTIINKSIWNTYIRCWIWRHWWGNKRIPLERNSWSYQSISTSNTNSCGMNQYADTINHWSLAHKSSIVLLNEKCRFLKSKLSRSCDNYKSQVQPFNASTTFLTWLRSLNSLFMVISENHMFVATNKTK